LNFQVFHVIPTGGLSRVRRVRCGECARLGFQCVSTCGIIRVTVPDG
jgi:hypothetical protein